MSRLMKVTLVGIEREHPEYPVRAEIVAALAGICRLEQGKIALVRKAIACGRGNIGRFDEAIDAGQHPAPGPHDFWIFRLATGGFGIMIAKCLSIPRRPALLGQQFECSDPSRCLIHQRLADRARARSVSLHFQCLGMAEPKFGISWRDRQRLPEPRYGVGFATLERDPRPPVQGTRMLRREPEAVFVAEGSRSTVIARPFDPCACRPVSRIGFRVSLAGFEDGERIGWSIERGQGDRMVDDGFAKFRLCADRRFEIAERGMMFAAPGMIAARTVDEGGIAGVFRDGICEHARCPFHLSRASRSERAFAKACSGNIHRSRNQPVIAKRPIGAKGGT